MKLLYILFLYSWIVRDAFCSKEPLKLTVDSSQSHTNSQELDTSILFLQQSLNTTTDTLRNSGQKLTRGLSSNSFDSSNPDAVSPVGSTLTGAIVYSADDHTPKPTSSSLDPSDSSSRQRTIKSSSSSEQGIPYLPTDDPLTPRPKLAPTDQPVTDPMPVSPTTDQPMQQVPGVFIPTSTGTPNLVQPSTIIMTSPTIVTTTSTTSLVEANITSISPSNYLGDQECASDHLAQSDGRCLWGYYCNAASQKCVAQLYNGRSCVADFQCLSFYCVGVCDILPVPIDSSYSYITGNQLIGITLGSIGGVILLVVCLFYIYHYRKKQLALLKQHFAAAGSNNMVEPGATTTNADNCKNNPRLSKYNYLTQIVDDQKQQQTDNQDNTHRPPSSILHQISETTTSLRPRPITGDLTPPPSVLSSSSYRGDYSRYSYQASESLDQRHDSIDYRSLTNRDSMTDTTLSSHQPYRHYYYSPNQQQHIPVNPLWDDALQSPSYHHPWHQG
ncbi:hypothetical protein BC941DRAFT_431396 [Chlamydoabsidia padenii]|nr:hypothetical protein BC941DRAFT_431396 [Chlamydoabsidia padenii]